MWAIIVGCSLVLLACILQSARMLDEGFYAQAKAVKKPVPKKVSTKKPAAKKPAAKKPAATVAVMPVFDTQVGSAFQRFPAYDPTKSYTVGDKVMWNGNAYYWTSTPSRPGQDPTIPAWKPMQGDYLQQGFQSYQNPYNSSSATAQTLEFRLGQVPYSAI